MNNIKIEELVRIIYEKYDKKVASEPIKKILQRISNGGNYKDLYEYIRDLDFGEIITEAIYSNGFALNMQQYNEVKKELVPLMDKYYNDISDLTKTIQKSLNEMIGIGIKPKTVPKDTKKILKMVDIIINGMPTESEEIAKIAGFNNELIQYAVELVDATIKANADLQTKSGLEYALIRRYDDIGIHNYANYSEKRKATRKAEVCEFCKSLEGVYDYNEISSIDEVWRRHKGCSCSIDLVYKGMTDRVKNYR